MTSLELPLSWPYGDYCPSVVWGLGNVFDVLPLSLYPDSWSYVSQSIRR